MDDSQLKEFEPFWGKDKHCYVLTEVRPDSSQLSGRYLIFDLRSNRAVLICNNQLAREVIRRMLEAGVSIGDPHEPRIRKAFMRRRLGLDPIAPKE